jgi:hypothetical protein
MQYVQPTPIVAYNNQRRSFIHGWGKVHKAIIVHVCLRG